MERLTSIEGLRALQKRVASVQDPSVPTIVIPAGTCGQASGASDLIRTTKKELIEKKLTNKVHLRITGCHGFCEMEPSVLVEPQRTFYPRVGINEMLRIIEATAEGKVLDDLLFVDPETGEKIQKQDDIPFFKKQVRTILSRNEKVDPRHISDYLAVGGYSALAKAICENTPESVIAEIKASGLRGRGGAGFPTALKWEMLAKAPGTAGKYLICNADEGDPGAYMDRSVLEGNPHSIIEGMTIGAYATGATEGIIYVRAEYPLAIKHLNAAIKEARERGVLGEAILGTGFSFDITVVKGAGAFVCGEETALIRSIEGRMGEPKQRPPFPVEKGIFGLPTVINNVETWANVSIVIDKGSEAFAAVGTKNNSGTKIFSLVGKVKNTGLIEVPMGISIEEIIYDIGGGPSGKAKIKAVQTGGPSGGCIPTDQFDLKIDYDSLAKAGSIMGSGGMIVMDENTCIVDIAKYYTHFLKDESCGKCYTCRKGTQRMYEILDDITTGNATPEHLDLLEELALVVKDTTMCGLGQTSANPVLSSLRYFRDEYEKHIYMKRCDAFVCKDLVGAPCQTACPVGTEAWRYVACVEKGDYEAAYRTIREANPFPSVCARVCNHPCEDKCKSGSSGNQPVAIKALKRFVVEQVDPSVYKPAILKGTDAKKIAVVGAGPAGLTAAHYLSLKGYKVTLFEESDEPGGMLLCAIPAYRLPHDTVRKEIESLLNENITVKCKTALGRDITIDSLKKDGFDSVFVALGAQKSRKLGLEGEDAEGIHPSIEFLKDMNLNGKSLAKGRVGIVGGGNSAIDAARMAIRQDGVKSVTIFYRRTQDQMPAYAEEIKAAIEEGVKIETLVSPTKVLTEKGRLTGIQFIHNELGKMDSSGRRSPVEVAGTEFEVELDTLVVAISEECETSGFCGETRRNGAIKADHETLATSLPGVFAGGDVITGPNTVIDAVAAGKKAAAVIDRYLCGEELTQLAEPRLPRVYVEPSSSSKDVTDLPRAETRTISVKARKGNLAEVELPFSIQEAVREAQRCLRCDLEFTKPKEVAEDK